MPPCMCGDSECPSCGAAQGTRTEKVRYEIWGKKDKSILFISNLDGIQKVRENGLLEGLELLLPINTDTYEEALVEFNKFLEDK